jgi:hypothetical protein
MLKKYCLDKKNCTKVNEIKNIKFKIKKKLNKYYPKNNKINHYNVGNSHGAYIGLYHRIRLYVKPHK